MISEVHAELITGTGRRIVAPTAVAIRSALVEAHRWNPSLVGVLASSRDLLEATPATPSTFALRFAPTAGRRHERSVREDLPSEAVESALVAFSDGDDSWRRTIEWRLVAWPRDSEAARTMRNWIETLRVIIRDYEEGGVGLESDLVLRRVVRDKVRESVDRVMGKGESPLPWFDVECVALEMLALLRQTDSGCS